MGSTGRRSFLKAAFSLLASLHTASRALAGGNNQASRAGSWYQGDVVHILPTASHRRFLVKCSFRRALTEAPSLRVNTREVVGQRSDSAGHLWQFDVDGLHQDTRHELQLTDSEGRALCDAWPLRTLPAPEQSPERLRIVTFTCAGGDGELTQSDGVNIFLPLPARQRLLERALDLDPDLIIANGDQIYYDERTMLKNKPPLVIEAWKRLFSRLGVLKRGEPMYGGHNERILKTIGERQIARLYGVRLRSVPVFMLTDDHDLFDNDEATEELITLPADGHMMSAARAVQHLFYPEFLPDPSRPGHLPGSNMPDRNAGLSEVFGTVRYGDLFEALLYDTKRYVTTGGEDARMVPAAVEDWLVSRTRAGSSRHLFHVPSTPMGWSAGKWGEWYPDVLGPDDELTTERPKPYWPPGWWLQHQRILGAIGGQRERIPVVMSGDLHMFAAAEITASGNLDFSRHPVHAVVVGPLGSGEPAFPSAARGVLPRPPTAMRMREHVKPFEKNGFTAIDIDRKRIKFRFFAWRPPEPLSAIDGMPPANEFELKRSVT